MHQQQELNLSIASSVGLRIYLYSLQNQLYCSFVLNCCFMMMMDHVDPSRGGFCVADYYLAFLVSDLFCKLAIALIYVCACVVCT
jgi:hypothetical protein